MALPMGVFLLKRKPDASGVQKRRWVAIGRFFKRFFNLFAQNRVTTSAAGLSYYFTMTLFPLIICVYTLLGNNYELSVRVLSFLQPVLPERSFELISSFMDYVSDNYSIAMMVLALSVILITASAGIRSLESAIGQMQGKRRYDGFFFFFFSVILSLALLFTLYFGIVVMFMGEAILSRVSVYLPFLQIDNIWTDLRYPLLFVLGFLMIMLLFTVCKSREDHYSVIPGALLATLMLVGVSALFSRFINASVKYPLVYSSLASLVLIMFWLYCCSLSVYCGSVMNIALRDGKAEKQAEKEKRISSAENTAGQS